MIHRLLRLLLALMLIVGGTSFCAAQLTIEAPFNAFYTALELGSVPGVPLRYGGVNFALGNANRLIIGGSANASDGALYSIDLARDLDGHITGFAGTAALVASAPFNDGGVTYGPGNVLFLSRWPVNQLGQLKPGSTATDKVIDLAPLGVEGSHAAINFVPAGFPGAGKMKLVSYGGGQWTEAQYLPDGFGTYNITSITEIPASRLSGGPEGFFYVPPLSPGFPTRSMVVAEYAAGSIAAYEVDANGDPIVASRRLVLSGLSSAEGSVIDPVTGDLLFSTFGGGDKLVALRGFIPSLRGDFNQDSHVDGADLPVMLAALADVNAYRTDRGLSDGEVLAIADVNRSGIFTNADMQTLLDVLKAGGGSLHAVPEPGTLMMAAIGLMALGVVAQRRLPKACSA